MMRLLLAAVLTSVVALGTGCSSRPSDMPELGTVHGKVTLDGKPLSGVTIYFKPEVGRMSIAKSDEEGFYEAYYLIDEKGVKVGPCKVIVEWGIDETGPPIPPQYGVTGSLTFDVKPGDNEFNIDMKSR
ncbi:MAG: hypothetical protein GXP27_19700 [Planctomycetes bacterium]|nr:hypothetical protein [Planctomycetota bacterium]